MAGPDLDTLRAILSSLDVAPLFEVVAGDHLRGLSLPDSPVVVRGVHRSALDAALGGARRTPVLEIELLDRGTRVQFRSEEPGRAAERLLRGEPGALEAFLSPHVVTGAEQAARARDLVPGLLTRRLARRYLARARGAERALAGGKAPRVRRLLELYRSLLAGITLLAEGRLEPDLHRLLQAHGIAFLARHAKRPWRPGVIGEPARFDFYLREAWPLFDRLEEELRSPRLPERPPAEARQRLERWVASVSEPRAGSP